MRYKTILTIAGSDSAGGAGIQADIKTATLLGCYAMSVITAVTAQNSHGVKGFEPVSGEMLEMQLETVLSDMKPDAIKIGMIPSPEAAQIIGRLLRKYEAKNVVYDPVMVSTSGKGLCGNQNDFIEAIKTELLPVTTLLTPNIPEALTIIGESNTSETNALSRRRKYLGLRILSLGGDAVLVKGGHGLDKWEATDTLVIDKKRFGGEQHVVMDTFTHWRIDTPNLHGTGCVLSSAIACFLAKGLPIQEAVEQAKDFLTEAINKGAEYEFGSPGGYGPLYLIKNQ